MSTHLYLGPSLEADEARRLLPGVLLHPPVAGGDLLRLDLGVGDVVILIDGYFLQERSVRHREIRHLLARGVTVWGASSMGALRAAEMASLGMRGHGWVYEQLASGALEGDDEVAVLHGPAAQGYPVVAEALVTVRRTLDAAVRAGAVSGEQATALLARAQRLPFPERSWERIAAAAAVDPDALTAHRVDIKAEDARSLLSLLGRTPAPSAAPVPRPVLAGNPPRDLLLSQWLSEAPAADGVSVSDCVSVCRLLGSGYVEWQRRVLLQGLARLAAEAGCDGSGDDPDGVRALARQIGLGPVGGRAWEERWLRPDEAGLETAERERRVLARVVTLNPGVRPLHWVEDALGRCGALARARVVAAAAHRFNAEVAQDHPGFRVGQLARRGVVELFASRWGLALDDLAAMDRGYADLEELSRAARFLYLYVRECSPRTVDLEAVDQQLTGSAQARGTASERAAAGTAAPGSSAATPQPPPDPPPK